MDMIGAHADLEVLWLLTLVKVIGKAGRDRTQVQNPVNGNYTKRDTDTGRFIDQKKGGEPFKGVAQEKDNRRK